MNNKQGSHPIQRGQIVTRFLPDLLFEKYKWLRKLMLIKIIGFGVVKSVGFGLDLIVFSLFLSFALQPMLSNVFAAAVGITFTYYMTIKYVFYYRGQFLMMNFLIYLIWNIFRVALFSYLIQQFTIIFGLYPFVPKIIITPVSFYIDFLFINYLITRQLKFY